MSHANPSDRTLEALAEALGGEVRGDGGFRPDGLRTLEGAGPEDLSYANDLGLVERARVSQAGALMVSPDLAEALAGESRPLLVVEDPARVLVELIPHFHPPVSYPAGIHPTAVVADGCTISESAHVGPYAVVGEGAEIAAQAVVLAHAVVGRDCVVGPRSVLHPHAVLYDRTTLGAEVQVHSGAVLGADGFGYVTRGGEHVKVPQVGRTVVEDGVEVGANSTIDRALLEETRIGRGSKIDNLVQVGHNVTLGQGCILCGQAGIAGSAELGNYVVLGGQAGSAGHLQIGDGVQVAAKSAVLQSVPAGRKVGGVPAIDLAAWRRQALSLPRLGELMRRVRALEKRLEAADGGRSAGDEGESV